ncbi:hypothetical protein [uncultured Gammaproteobacteria bacterium]|uniref:Uncharacterized protein n=2 Tax=sulfur-oxidizing symbionts TaxID=32036 RepID=A0A1H6MAY3_9GAMM|nr:hypothetical protein AZO1586I_1112 [Bathymodiolus thermophilus thioautotrophic gill symbiont]CAC5814945.1 hypothetical protein [uncultured Gammaproteobacteria bacterium]SEH98532.1 hypothetical protein BAZSYMA_ACONTIG28768_0 [Bathymodiolus azoricus thioautotrophic gill symbiont]CAC9485872.1 hypothetical protein [uncultured Gammaproteobacteria bacterium]CAC9496014.1 hypothetical protein [uncultured Gammaproteobacteria bacterium]
MANAKYPSLEKLPASNLKAIADNLTGATNTDKSLVIT